MTAIEGGGRKPNKGMRYILMALVLCSPLSSSLESETVFFMVSSSLKS